MKKVQGEFRSTKGLSYKNKQWKKLKENNIYRRVISEVGSNII